LFQLQNVLDVGTLMRPLPVLGKYQFIPDKEFLLRLDLDTGEILAAPDKKEYMLFGQGSQLYYLAASDIADKPGSSERKAESMEIGKLNPATLAATPLLKLNAEEQYGELTGFGAAARDGSRLALTTELSKAPKVLLFGNNKLEKTLTLAKEDSGLTVGNVEWSSDGKALYVAYARKQENAPCRYGVLEAPVDGGSVREIPLFSGDSSDNWLVAFQIAISPNGRTLAGSSTCFENNNDIESKDRALYLVDLGSAARTVTRVPVPLDRTAHPDKAKK
jgi:dipeptidyl aminopeptidase/acylaminoacyl peptidase